MVKLQTPQKLPASWLKGSDWPSLSFSMFSLRVWWASFNFFAVSRWTKRSNVGAGQCFHTPKTITTFTCIHSFLGIHRLVKMQSRLVSSPPPPQSTCDKASALLTQAPLAVYTQGRRHPSLSVVCEHVSRGEPERVLIGQCNRAAGFTVFLQTTVTNCSCANLRTVKYISYHTWRQHAWQIMGTHFVGGGDLFQQLVKQIKHGNPCGVTAALLKCFIKIQKENLWSSISRRFDAYLDLKESRVKAKVLSCIIRSWSR